MKFKGTIEELKEKLKPIEGGWGITTQSGAVRFDSNDGGILLWHLTTGTIQFQGATLVKDLLELQVTDLLTDSTNKETQLKFGTIEEFKENLKPLVGEWGSITANDSTRRGSENKTVPHNHILLKFNGTLEELKEKLTPIAVYWKTQSDGYHLFEPYNNYGTSISFNDFTGNILVNGVDNYKKYNLKEQVQQLISETSKDTGLYTITNEDPITTELVKSLISISTALKIRINEADVNTQQVIKTLKENDSIKDIIDLLK